MSFDLSEQEEESPSFVGVVLAIVGSSLIGLSYTASKTAHNKVLTAVKNTNNNEQNDKNDEEQSRVILSPGAEESEVEIDDETDPLLPSFSMTSTMKMPIWWLSILLLLSGEICNFLAYGFAPTSVIAPLGTLSIISGALSGYVYLGERMQLRNLFGMILSCIGAAIIVLFSRSEEPKLDPEAIIGALSQLRFIIYAFITTALAFILLFLDLNPIKPNGETLGDRFMAVRVSLTAIFSGFTVLSTKSLSSLLSLTLYKLFSFWISYVLFVVLVGNALLTLYFTNKALASFDSTKVLPAEFAAFTLSAVLGSAMLYDDFDTATSTEVILFIAGCCVVFIGVYLITSGDDKFKNLTADRTSMIFPTSFPVLSAERLSMANGLTFTYDYGGRRSIKRYLKPGESARTNPKTSIDSASITTRTRTVDFGSSPALITETEESNQLLWYSDESLSKRLSRTGLMGLARVINALGNNRASLTFQQVVLQKELQDQLTQSNNPAKKRKNTRIFIVPNDSKSEPSKPLSIKIDDEVLRQEKSPPHFEVLSARTSHDELTYIVRPLNQSSVDLITSASPTSETDDK